MGNYTKNGNKNNQNSNSNQRTNNQQKKEVLNARNEKAKYSDEEIAKKDILILRQSFWSETVFIMIILIPEISG